MSNDSQINQPEVDSGALFDGLVDRQKEIERALGDSEDYSEWVARPGCAGWWLWLEGGTGCRTDLLLVGRGGTHIADNDEWERATGLPAEHDGFQENYWEGTETTQRMMPGLWFFLSNDQAKP